MNLLAADPRGGGNTSQARPRASVAQPRRHLSAALRAGFPAQQEQLIRLPAPVTCGAGGERGRREGRTVSMTYFAGAAEGERCPATVPLQQMGLFLPPPPSPRVR